VHPALDLSLPADRLTAALVDRPSVSGAEGPLTDAVETALRPLPLLRVERIGNVIVARTHLQRSQRVVLAGHLDTVPVAGNLPSRVSDGRLFGCGTSDMKSGVALQLRAARLIGSGELTPTTDVTWLFYDCEEVDAARNGLNRLAVERPDLLAGDLAVLLEPTNGRVEGGCQGTMRVAVTITGRRAHSARSWLGDNAVHRAAELLADLRDYRARVVDVEGLTYREGLNAVSVSGGVAGNVIPDECTITVNYRFAPDRSEAEAEAHVRDVLGGADRQLTVLDSAPPARPGLDQSLAQAFVAAIGEPAEAKLGWTDVARFSALGIPALNFGPGDPNLAHTVDESVELATVDAAESALLSFLSRDPA
jgi:succinyl-diaminopimelate desuccinylase